jgi:endonuclease/exonuclease/phosphatase family metal-dependent hydrolase
MPRPAVSRSSLAALALFVSAMGLDQAVAAGPAGRGSDQDFTVATWNLEWFYDETAGDNYSKLAREQSAPDRAAWNWKRDTVAEAIATLEPDVLALQEIEGQRVLYYLTQALGRLGAARYRIGFVEGSDYHTEQDVGFLVQQGTDITRIARYEQSRAMFESDQFHNVAKHAEIVVDVPVGDGVEQVTILTVHFRAREEAVEPRTRQARLVHAWLRGRIAAGENIIVLGDTNSETTDLPAPEGSDLAALTGRDTPGEEDDLIDLHRYLDPVDRRTHLLDGKQYDRILVSPSLLEDAPGREDLVFTSIAVRRDLAVRSGVDSPETHWDKYWETAPVERDTSDHWPVVATFSVK